MRTATYLDRKNLQQKTAAWLDRVRGSVAPRPGLQLNPARCALLVIDMLRYFTHPAGRCYLSASAAIVPQIKVLLAAWRSKSGPVIYTRHGHRNDTDLGMLGKFFSDYIRADEPQGEILPAVAPVGNELVIRKTTYDAFWGTSLQEYLTKRGIDQVLICGVLTHMCCETTARSAFCRGFEVYLPVDGMATSTEERHVSSLLALADAVAVVMSTAEVVERCSKSA